MVVRDGRPSPKQFRLKCSWKLPLSQNGWERGGLFSFESLFAPFTGRLVLQPVRLRTGCRVYVRATAFYGTATALLAVDDPPVNENWICNTLLPAVIEPGK